jgi:hypothetical protein
MDHFFWGRPIDIADRTGIFESMSAEEFAVGDGFLDESGMTHPPAPAP